MAAADALPIRIEQPTDPLPPVGLYVHVPFCIGLCPYCDFVVYAGGAARGPGSLVPAYLAAVRAELELRADALDARFEPPGADHRPALRSVYLGGGTPSLLPAGDVAALLDGVAARFGLAPGAEVTLEANPGPEDRGDLDALAGAGVTRLSLGAQSLHAGDLRRLGRRHGPEDVREAVAAARRAGFRDVSVDLLYDVPGQTLATWESTLLEAVALGVDHVSAYALTLDDPGAEGLAGPAGDHLPTTTGARRWREGARADQDQDRAAAAYELADEILGAAGLPWYELSNWARPGHESRHNLAYWRHEPYEAIGPGAHAFDGAGTRRWNAARFARYVAALAPSPGNAAAPSPGQMGPALPPGGQERLGASTYASEAIILALRLRSGIDAETAALELARSAVEWGRAHGLVETSPDRHLRLTLRGRLLSNEVFTRCLD
jgi:putative oxygen-independent coproporphyrinogen III oxidase